MCCPHLNVTLGYEVCIPGNCPSNPPDRFCQEIRSMQTSRRQARALAFYPQICDFQPSSASSSASTGMSRSPSITGSPTLTTSPSSSSTATSIATASRTNSQFGDELDTQSSSQIPASQTTSQLTVLTPTQSQTATRTVSQSIVISTQSQSPSVDKSTTDPINAGSRSVSPSSSEHGSFSRTQSSSTLLSQATPTQSLTSSSNGTQTATIVACAAYCSNSGSRNTQTVDVDSVAFKAGVGAGVVAVFCASRGSRGIKNALFVKR